MIMFVDESGAQKTKLQEQNRKRFVEGQKAAHERLLKETAQHCEIKDIKKVVDFDRPDFSIKAFREASYALSRRLKEANAEATFAQLLRAGVQNTFNDIYSGVEVTYDAICRETSSNKRQEFYSPIERVGFPKTVPQGDSFPETDFKGLDLELVNVKYGLIFAVQRELLDDDQTGQIVQRAGQLGENARIQEEALVWGTFSAISGQTFDGEAIPASSTFSTVYATGTPGTSGGIHGNGRGVNELTSARLSQSGIQSAWILAKQMLDQSGRPMLVNPNILAISPQDVFVANVLLNSDNSPAVPSTTAGATGGIFAVNPIKQLVAVVASRFIPQYAWYMAEAGKGFCFQRRDPTEVVQENPQSGPAFSQEVFRYRLRSRWKADFIDPKFVIAGNQSQSST